MSSDTTEAGADWWADAIAAAWRAPAAEAAAEKAAKGGAAMSSDTEARAAFCDAVGRIAEIEDDNARLRAKVEELHHDISGLSSALRDREREIHDLQIQLRMVRDDAQREVDDARRRFLTRR